MAAMGLGAAPEEPADAERHSELDALQLRSGAPEEMWREVIGERSAPVGKLGRVRAPKGVRLRRAPAVGAADLGVLPFDELVFVERRTEHGWCWVLPTTALSGNVGFCEEQFLALDPPEPSAHLHRVAPGDELRKIAEQAYGKSFRGGRDARLYVQAIYEANKGKAGIYLTEVELSTRERAERLEADEQTLEVYKGAKVREGQAIWLPSEAYIEALRASGQISDGTPAHAKLARGLKDAAGQAVDGAKYSAAFAVGILEGSWGAIADLFQGAAEMIQVVAKTLYEIVTGNLGAIKDMLMGWVGKLKQAWEHRGDMAADFMAKWEADDAWTRGNFQGEVLGWVMMTALLIFATAGEAAVAMATGKWATVLKVLRAADALGDITTYVGRAARLPGEAIGVIRRRLGRGTEAAADLAGSTATKESRQLTSAANENGALDASPGSEAPAAVGGGKFGVDPDSGIDMLTDPHPPPEVREAIQNLRSGGESTLKYDAKEAFRKLMKSFVTRRSQEVDSVLAHLKQTTGTGLERVTRAQLEQVFDYLFQSNGIALDYANFSAWRRVSTGGGKVDDLRFLRHELEELKLLREGGLEDPLGKNLAGKELDDWRDAFLDEHYLPAHRKALDVELDFLRQEVRQRTKGLVDLSSEELAMSDLTRTEGKIHALRDGASIEEHANAKRWNRSAEQVTLTPELAQQLQLPSKTTIAKVIQAVKNSQVGGAQ